MNIAIPWDDGRMPAKRRAVNQVLGPQGTRGRGDRDWEGWEGAEGQDLRAKFMVICYRATENEYSCVLGFFPKINWTLLRFSFRCPEPSG